MATITTGLMTFEEFEQLPEHSGRQELLLGELIELPPAKLLHDITAHRVYHAILDAAKALRCEAFIAVGYRVTRKPDSWLIPDVSVTHADQPRGDYYEGAPLLAVEVVSPSNSPEQIATKIDLYLANGSKEVWVINRKTTTAWVYRPGSATEMKGTLTSSLFPGFSLDLNTLWAK